MDNTVATYTIQQLAAWEVPFVFGLAGDTVIPLLEALRRQEKVRYIGVRHEESAAFMASAYAKLTGNLGVCLAEAGPAAVHLLNGVYDAHLDRVPLLAITGQSASYLLGTHWPQTINQDLLFADATAYNHTLTNEQQLPDVLYHAMRTAVVHADACRLGMPVDMQNRPLSAKVRKQPQYLRAVPAPDTAAIDSAAALLQQAQRPLLLVGQGARGQARPVLDLAEKLKAAIIHTLPAAGIIPADYPRNLGVIGEFGTEPAAEAFAQADVVLVLATTWWQPKYVPSARFIQVDREPRHLGMLFPAEVGLAGDVKDILPQLSQRLSSASGRDDWDQLVHDLHNRWRKQVSSVTSDATNGRPLDHDRRVRAVAPQRIIGVLQDQLADDAIICLDVGDNTFWVSSLFQTRKQQVVLSGHWRSMGFALPAAVAAALISPQRQVVAIAGDGGFAMTMAEFTTAVRLELPIIVVVMNNHSFSHEGHLQAQVRLEPFGIGLHNPDFSQYALACGGDGYRVDSGAGLERALSAALKSKRPSIIDINTQRVMPPFPKARGTLKPSLTSAPAPYAPLVPGNSR